MGVGIVEVVDQLLMRVRRPEVVLYKVEDGRCHVAPERHHVHCSNKAPTNSARFVCIDFYAFEIARVGMLCPFLGVMDDGAHLLQEVADCLSVAVGCGHVEASG